MNMGQFPLQGITILEYGRSKAVKLATRLLAGYGAIVLIADPHDGDHLDEARRIYLDGGKSFAQGELAAAFRDADIVVTDRLLAERDGAGIGDDVAAQAGTIVIAVTPHGEASLARDWPTSELVQFAEGGQMSTLGDPGREPLQAYGDQANGQASLHVFGAVMAALIRKARFGIVSGTIDISVQEVQASALEVFAGVAFNRDAHDIIAPMFLPKPSGNGLHAVWAMYECADGIAGIHVNPPNWNDFCDVIGRPDWHGRGRDRALLVSDELRQIVSDLFRDRTKAQVMELAREHGIPVSFVAEPDDLLNASAIASSGLWRDVRTQDGRSIRVPGPLCESPLRFEIAKEGEQVEP